VIGLIGEGLSPLTADALASLVAIAMERARSLERESQAEAERKIEELRTAVLDALAHEYKTPLTSLRAAAGGLIEIGHLNPVQLELISLIDSEVSRLDLLTTRLLRMSRLDSAEVRLRPELVDPNELVLTVLANMQDLLAGHEVHIENSDGEAFLNADRELVSMALTQFIDNALKYSDPGRRITVLIAATASEVCLSVNNFGPLIPAEERQRIFQRFYRGLFSSHKPAGTGIGLSISRKVADAHHGRVWVTSEQKSGNTFSLALPRCGKDEL
jgi:two-component system sensor histidine kinase KdpD